MRNDADGRLLRAQTLPEFPTALGIELTLVSEDLVEGRMPVRPLHANRNGVLHGGAVMAFADTLGGTGAIYGLPLTSVTATIESKTNFLRKIELGDVAVGKCVRLHGGRKISVWQTTVYRGDGKPAAIVTQTQMTIDWQSSE